MAMVDFKVALVYAVLILIGVTGAIGDILVSRWAKTNEVAWLIGSYAFWIISVTLFGFFMRSERFAFSAAIFVAFLAHGSVSVVFDMVALRTRLNREEWLGIALAVVALLVLEVGRGHREEAAEIAISLAVDSGEGQ